MQSYQRDSLSSGPTTGPTATEFDRTAGLLQERANDGISRAADAATGLADTLRQRAADLPGDRTTDIAYQAAAGLERGAEYLRETDLDGMRGDLEDLIRRYPAQSLVAGLAIGFLLARAFR
jgi:hypothetical protein